MTREEIIDHLVLDYSVQLQVDGDDIIFYVRVINAMLDNNNDLEMIKERDYK